MEKYDYLIVGSGLFGATFAYKARQAGKRCLVIDRRPHLGGNVYCSPTLNPSSPLQPPTEGEASNSLPTGEGRGGASIHVHKYGAHIFHTSNKEVWDFVNSLVPFNRYTNSPIANYHGELYNLPFNMNTFNRLWGVKTPEEAKRKLEEQRAEAVAALAGREPANLEEQALTLVGKDVFEKLIKEYTEKQWGRKCTELPAFIIKRLPVRLTYDNNYFNDKYQGIPIGGYNKLIEGLLEGVDTKTNTDFFHSEFSEWKKWSEKLVYTGPLDEYFNFKLGKLDWRTVTFKTRVENIPNFQGNAVVNYTSHDVPYTRVIEHKHFEMFGQEVYDCPFTVISEEYSTEYREGMEPYYPVNDERNNALAAQYKELAHQEGVLFPEDVAPPQPIPEASSPTRSLSPEGRELEASPSGGGMEGAVIFGGRLAQYKYYDMAPIIEQVLSLF